MQSVVFEKVRTSRPVKTWSCFRYTTCWSLSQHYCRCFSRKINQKHQSDLKKNTGYTSRFLITFFLNDTRNICYFAASTSYFPNIFFCWNETSWERRTNLLFFLFFFQGVLKLVRNLVLCLSHAPKTLSVTHPPHSPTQHSLHTRDDSQKPFQKPSVVSNWNRKLAISV